MKHLASKVLLFLALLLPLFFGACKHLPTSEYISVEPSWAEDCTPSNTEFLSWAQEIQELDVRAEEIPLTAQEALAFCKQDILDQGFKFADKPRGVLGDFENFTTTLPINFVWLTPGLSDRSIKAQALTYCHERVHMYTEKRLRLQGSASIYLSDVGRWAFEAAPYRLTIQLARRWGENAATILRRAERTVESLWKGYFLQGIPKRCLRQTAFEYWSLPLPTAEASP